MLYLSFQHRSFVFTSSERDSDPSSHSSRAGSLRDAYDINQTTTAVNEVSRSFLDAYPVRHIQQDRFI